MTTAAPHPRVLLIGGTSHTGKSTLAQSLASTLGWRYITTDLLARHPGRPWKTAPETVPQHVAEHYLTLSVNELIADVLRHYRDNVWPIAKAFVMLHVNDPAQGGLVMEGSALWPESVVSLDLDRIAAVWLTAGDDLFEARIYHESRYQDKTGREQTLIDKFLARTLAYNTRMMEAVNRLGLSSIDLDTTSSQEDLAGRCLSLLQRQK
ncbi:MAG: 2-phosphoglycerate kinase [Anaerolineae bacterium]|nr:2-phosphoglycerate kinase [Anaerolineae bacterium]